MKLKKTTKATTRHYIELDKDALLFLLRSSGWAVPDKAEIKIRVPGGRDWSNEYLEVDGEEQVINVCWTEEGEPCPE